VKCAGSLRESQRFGPKTGEFKALHPGFCQPSFFLLGIRGRDGGDAGLRLRRARRGAPGAGSLIV